MFSVQSHARFFESLAINLKCLILLSHLLILFLYVLLFLPVLLHSGYLLFKRVCLTPGLFQVFTDSAPVQELFLQVLDFVYELLVELLESREGLFLVGKGRVLGNHFGFQFFFSFLGALLDVLLNRESLLRLRYI